MAGEIDAEAIEAVAPLGVSAAEPVVHREQALDLKSSRSALALAGPIDEAGRLQHLEVLGDGGLGQREGLGEFGDASLAGCEAFEDRPAGGVGKGREGAAQGIADRHYSKVI